MYEHRKQPLAKRSVFAKRLALNGVIGLILLMFSLGMGILAAPILHLFMHHFHLAEDK